MKSIITLLEKRYIKITMAKLHERSDCIKIGITGSYGKTTVKEILKTILLEKYNVLAKDGLIVVEHDFKNVFCDDDFSFDTRKCGSVALSFLEYKQGE